MNTMITGRRFALLLMVLLAAALVPPGSPALAQGDTDLPGLAGGALTAADLARGRTVLVVWASWSPRCRDIVAQVNALQSKWGSRARVVTVNFQEEGADASRFLQGGLAVPTFLDHDGAFAKRHAVATLPGLVVYVDGRVVYQGRLPADGDSLLGELLQ